jgi:hypothetical protein
VDARHPHLRNERRHRPLQRRRPHGHLLKNSQGQGQVPSRLRQERQELGEALASGRRDQALRLFEERRQ